MATYTTHYNLKKPALADKIRIADFNGNADTIDSQMYDNASLGAQLKADIGIVENTNTAAHNISAGQYVIWKGSLYTASSAISSGATLSTANLTAVSGGGLNALNDKVNVQLAGMKILSNINNETSYSFPLASNSRYRLGLVTYKTGSANTAGYLGLLFIRGDNTPYLTQIYKGTNEATITASYSNGNLIFSSSTTIYGGIRVIYLD